jgi:hypothetical protein
MQSKHVKIRNAHHCRWGPLKNSITIQVLVPGPRFFCFILRKLLGIDCARSRPCTMNLNFWPSNPPPTRFTLQLPRRVVRLTCYSEFKLFTRLQHMYKKNFHLGPFLENARGGGYRFFFQEWNFSPYLMPRLNYSPYNKIIFWYNVHLTILHMLKLEKHKYFIWFGRTGMQKDQNLTSARGGLPWLWPLTMP